MTLSRDGSQKMQPTGTALSRGNSAKSLSRDNSAKSLKNSSYRAREGENEAEVGWAIARCGQDGSCDTDPRPSDFPEIIQHAPRNTTRPSAVLDCFFPVSVAGPVAFLFRCITFNGAVDSKKVCALVRQSHLLNTFSMCCT